MVSGTSHDRHLEADAFKNTQKRGRELLGQSLHAFTKNQDKTRDETTLVFRVVKYSRQE
jgi:hypothetical protein